MPVGLCSLGGPAQPTLQFAFRYFAELGRDGYVPQANMRDKQREYIEKSRDLRAQESAVAGLQAAVAAAERQTAQLASKYRSDLQNERVEAKSQYRKLQQDWVKQTRKSGLLELMAPQAGIAKDLVTHTAGTVVSPGTILMSLVPDSEALIAEVMIRNDDVGFVHPHQKVKLKLAAYPFQKYGMLDGDVMTIGADANDGEGQRGAADGKGKGAAGGYKAQVLLGTQSLRANGAG